MLSHNKKNNVRRLTVNALLLALSILFSYVESVIPLGFLPGVRLGLSHIPVMLLVIKGMYFDGALVALLRVFVFTLPFSGVSACLFALLGSLLSFLSLLLFYRIIGRIGLGMLSAAAHGMGQIISAVLIYNTPGLFFTYCPFLLLLAIPTGALSGFAVFILETKGAKIFENLA